MSDSLRTRKMSARHEDDLAEVLDGRRTRNSGAVWSDPNDGNHVLSDEYWRFSWDGKSTLGKSVGISREMWRKAVDDSRNLETLIPIRFYANERLTAVDIDLVALDLDVFAEMREDANTFRAILSQGCLNGIHDRVGTDTCSVCGASAYNAAEEI